MSEPTSPTAPARSGARKFVLDNLAVAAASALAKLRGLILLPLLIKGLGTAAYGTWSQIVAFAALAGGILSMNLHLPLVRQVAADRGNAAQIGTTLGAATVVGSLLGGTAIVVLTPDVAAAFIIGTDDRWILLCALGVVLASNLRTFALGVYRATEQIALRSALDLVTSAAELGALVCAATMGASLRGLMIVNVAASLCSATLIWIHAQRSIGFAKPSLRILKVAIDYSAPLVPAAVAAWVLDRSDRMLIGHFIDQRAVGVYSAQYALGSLLTFAQVPLQMTLVPKVASLWENEQETAKRYIEAAVRFFLTLAAPFVLVMPFAGPVALAVVAGGDVLDDAALNTTLVGLGAAFLGLGMIQSMVFYGARRTGIVGRWATFGAIANLLLNAMLLPRIGVAGAAIATMCTYALTCAAYWREARRILPLELPWRHLLRCIVAAVPAVALFWAYRASSWLGLLGTALAALLAYACLLLMVKAISPDELAAVRRLLRRRT